MSRRTDALPLRPRIAERPEIVFFDVGDTLLRVDPSWTGAYLAAAQSWGLDVSEGALAAAFAQALGEGLWDSFGPFDATPESSYQRIKQFDVRAMALLGQPRTQRAQLLGLVCQAQCPFGVGPQRGGHQLGQPQ